MVSGFMCADTDADALDKAAGWTFFVFCLSHYGRHGIPNPGEGNMWEAYQEWRHTEKAQQTLHSGLIGSPETIRKRLREFEATGVDQVILLNQAGRTTHDDICRSLDLFAREVMPEFHAREPQHARWKAVVTVRERSVLTITETPNRSTIDLDSGKFALAVAREKMRPGEEILIRTPNAVAAVRGTVVITEVNRQSAQAGGSAPAVLTNFYVLRGTVAAQPRDPNTGQPMGTPLSIGTMQAYSGAGTATPKATTVTQDQMGGITAGLQ